MFDAITLVPAPDPEPAPPFDPSRIDALPDADLDALPFGVICVDRTGRILRYNLAESRLARLDRRQVLGRNFFRTVAPCTQTPAFEGRFRLFVDGNLIGKAAVDALPSATVRGYIGDGGKNGGGGTFSDQIFVCHPFASGGVAFEAHRDVAVTQSTPLQCSEPFFKFKWMLSS